MSAPMNLWMTFWTVWLVLAGIAFAGITLIVAVKGFHDLRNMFAGLSGKNKN
jgi:hypothetical protein